MATVIRAINEPLIGLVKISKVSYSLLYDTPVASMRCDNANPMTKAALLNLFTLRNMPSVHANIKNA